jgi:multidrug resistance protein
MSRSPLVPIFLIVLVDMLAMMMIVPLLPFYAQHFDASAVAIGFLASSFAICQLVASPVLGKLSDRFGRRPVLIFSQAGTLLGLLLMAFANQLWILFAARIIDGITAGNLPLAQAAIADVTAPKDRARAFGIIGVAFGIGLILGPAVSGLLAAYDWVYPIYCAAGLSFLSIVTTWFLLPEAPPPAGTPENAGESWLRRGVLGALSFFGLFKRPALAFLLGQFFVFVFAFAYFAQGIGLFSQGRLTWAGEPFGPTEVGLTFAYCGVLGIVIQGRLIGRLVSWLGESRLVQVGFFCDVTGYAVLGFSSNLLIFLLACTLFSFGNSTLRPSLTSLVTQRAGRAEQGAVLGVMGSLQSIGQVVAPPLGGVLIDGELLTWWGLGLSLICVLGLVVGWCYRGVPADESTGAECV